MEITLPFEMWYKAVPLLFCGLTIVIFQKYILQSQSFTNRRKTTSEMDVDDGK